MKSKNQVANAEKNDKNVSGSPGSAGHTDKKGPASAEIRRRAHEIYMERGGTGGADLDDWLQAERELLANHRSNEHAGYFPAAEGAVANRPSIVPSQLIPVLLLALTHLGYPR